MYNKFDLIYWCLFCVVCENYVYIFKMVLFNVYNKYIIDLFKVFIEWQGKLIN